MSSNFEKLLIASQTFLHGVRALPSFQEQRTKQFQHLCSKLGKVKLKTEQIAKIFAIFDESLWGQHGDDLKSALAHTNVVEAVAERKKNQDFLQLVNYIPKTLWESMERDDSMMALEKLCAHAIKLGLQHPTETTQGLLLACVFDRKGGLLETQRWRITEMYKSNMKRFFDKALDPPVYLQMLPSDPEDLPKMLWDRAFSCEETPAIWAGAKALISIGKSWPMRASHSASSGQRMDLREQKQNYVTRDDLFTLGSMMFGAARRGEHTSQSLAGLEILKPGSASSRLESAPMLALKNEPENVEEAPAAPPVQSTSNAVHELGDSKHAPSRPASTSQGKSSVQQTLQALRASCKEKEKAKEATKRSKPTKRSSAALKKPAAKVLKRPAAKNSARNAQVASSGAQILDREARRQRILALVPKALKEQYKDGCCKCYWRSYCTPSCWKLRGYEA
jgi:hypothetical protein